MLPPRTRGSTRRHPLDGRYLELIQRLRTAAAEALVAGPAPGGEPSAAPPATDAESGETAAGAAAAAGGPPQPTWMRFVRLDGSSYGYNFADGSRADVWPEAAEIPPLDPELRPAYDEDVVAAALAYAARREKLAVQATRLFTFRSWWHEGAEDPDDKSNGESVGGRVKKQLLTILFNLEARTFEIQLENDRSVGLQGLSSLTARGGEPVECWDLHVGAKLNMLGKPTTLMWADQETMRWIDYHSRRLRRVKKALETHLRKYQTRPLTSAVTFEKGAPFSGGTSLRALIEQIRQLRDTLGGFRPRLAHTLARDAILYAA